MQDLRFALRMFTRRPGFAIIAAFTLALGVGATTAVYSIFYAVLLRPLPVRDPDRLVMIGETPPDDPARQMLALYPDFQEYRRSARLIEGVTAVARTYPLLAYNGVTRKLIAGPVVPGWFETVGSQPVLGRTFTQEDEQQGCSVVLDHRFWTETLGADPSILGKSLTLDQKPCMVLGVMGPRFSAFPRDAQVWMLMPGFDAHPERLGVIIFARLKPGVAKEQARQELVSLHRALHERDGAPAPGERREKTNVPLLDTIHNEWLYLFGGKVQNTLLLIFGAVTLLLLIACVNVANLLVARLADRRRELVVRAALGSSRARIVRQLLAESMLLSLAGTGLGVALAAAAIRYFQRARPIALPPGADVTLDPHVLLFAAGLSMGTMLACGLIPALRASRVDLSRRLKAAGRGFFGTGFRRRTVQALVAAEMTISVVLLAGAGLLMSSVLRINSEPLGFDPHRVYATSKSLPNARYAKPDEKIRFYDALVERLTRLPGVAGVALGSTLPPDGGGGMNLEIDGGTSDSKGPARRGAGNIRKEAVTGGYFNVLKVPLRRGRDFDATDREKSLAVAIVNDALVREYFPARDSVGQRIRLTYDDADFHEQSPWMTVVGVVETTVHNTAVLNEVSWSTGPAVYRPLAQDTRGQFEVAVRASGDAPELPQQMQEQIVAVDPLVPIEDIETLSGRLTRLLSYPRFRAMALTCFALGALMLSAIGLHGVLSQIVSQRIREFGVRRALGAQTRDLLKLVAVQGGVPVMVGLICGLASAVAFRRVLASLLYGVQPADPYVLAAVSVTLLTVAGVAMVLPARRATRVDPMIALRDN
jgi:predicted permease